MKKRYLLLFSLLSLTLLSFNFALKKEEAKIEKYAPPNASGPANNGNGDRTGSPLSNGSTCASCHSGGNYDATINVFITDPLGNQVTSYVPGQDYIIEYFILNNIGTPTAYGMQSVILFPGAGNVQAGTMTSVVTPGSQIVASGGYNYFEHTTPDLIGIFQVNWTAPATAGLGDVNIYAAGNAVNANGSTSGDEGTPPIVFTFPEACSPSASTDTQIACDSLTWLDGNTYTSSNNSATFLTTNSAGCDSTITLDLTINTVNSAVSLSGITLTADQAGAVYQWIDCDNGNVAISGATSQSYIASANGGYAVVVTDNGCSDTSACATVSEVGIVENSFGALMNVSPNPTSGNFSIDLGASYNAIDVSLTDLTGKLIESKHYTNSQILEFKLDEPAGVYLLLIQSEDKKALIRMMKN